MRFPESEGAKTAVTTGADPERWVEEHVFFSKDFVQYLHQRSPVVLNKPPANSDAHPIETEPNRLAAVD